MGMCSAVRELLHAKGRMDKGSDRAELQSRLQDPTVTFEGAGIESQYSDWLRAG
jgi:hypothetical protein